MNEQEEKKKKLILFGGTIGLMVILFVFWIFNFQAFLSNSDRAAIKNGKSLDLSAVKNKFNNAFSGLQKKLDNLSKQQEAAQQKSSSTDIKTFADSLEATIASTSAKNILATSSLVVSSTDFTVENLSATTTTSTIELASSSTLRAELKSDISAIKIKNNINEINKRIQSNK